MTPLPSCPDLCRGGGMTPAKMRKASDADLEAHRKAMMAAAVADGRGMTRKGWNIFHAIGDELKRRKGVTLHGQDTRDPSEVPF